MIVSAIFDTEDGTQLALTRLRESGIEVQSVNIRHRASWHGDDDDEGGFLAAPGPALGAGYATMMGGGAAPFMGVGFAPVFMGNVDTTATAEWNGETDRETKLEVQVRDDDAANAAGILRNAHGRHVKTY